jgi:hypothetical protein
LKLYFERRAAGKKSCQGTEEKSKRKFEVIGKRELLVQVPLPVVEVWGRKPGDRQDVSQAKSPPSCLTTMAAKSLRFISLSPIVFE